MIIIQSKPILTFTLNPATQINIIFYLLWTDSSLQQQKGTTPCQDGDSWYWLGSHRIKAIVSAQLRNISVLFYLRTSGNSSLCKETTKAFNLGDVMQLWIESRNILPLTFGGWEHQHSLSCPDSHQTAHSLFPLPCLQWGKTTTAFWKGEWQAHHCRCLCLFKRAVNSLWGNLAKIFHWQLSSASLCPLILFSFLSGLLQLALDSNLDGPVPMR